MPRAPRTISDLPFAAFHCASPHLNAKRGRDHPRAGRRGAESARRRGMARQETNRAFLDSAFLYGGNAGWIEELYARYAEDPNAVEAGWREFFAGLKGRP